MSHVSEELFHRLVVSATLTMMTSTFSLCSIFFISNISFSYPWRWFSDALWRSFSVGMLFGVIGNAAISFGVALLYHTKLSGSDKIACKYYQICSKILWNDIFIIAVTMILSGINSWVLLVAIAPIKYSSMISAHPLRVNERSHLLLCCGVFMGLIFSITTLIFNRLTLLYSHQKTNFFLIVSGNVVSRALNTVGRICYFVLVYALLPKPISGIKGFWWLLLDIRILLLLFVIGFHIQFTYNCAVAILRWQFTKPLNASLDSVLPAKTSSDGSELDTLPSIEKHLVLDCLADLVATDSVVRSSIFSLNSLGCRPLLWQQISNWCINVLDRFVATLNRVNNEEIQSNRLVIPTYSDAIAHQTHLPAFFKFQLRHRDSRPTVTPVSVLPNDNDLNNNINTRQDATKIDFVTALTDSIGQQNYKGLITLVSNQILRVLSHIPLIHTLALDIPHSRTARVFASELYRSPYGLDVLNYSEDGQIVIWAVEILACLTLSSYTEDTYGSVQSSLARILVLLVNAQEVAERHLRLTGLLTNELLQNHRPMDGGGGSGPAFVNQSPPTANVDEPVSNSNNIINSPVLRCGSLVHNDLAYYSFSSDPTLPWRVHATLSWAVSNCLCLFGEHLRSLPMSQDIKDKLQRLRKTCVKDTR